MRKLLFATLFCTLAASSTQAANLLTVLRNINTEVTNFSGPGTIAFDIDFGTHHPVVLRYGITEGDLGGPIALNAMIRNFSGIGFEHITLALSGASFQSIGSITRQFGESMITVSDDSRVARIGFSNPEFEYLDVAIGNPLNQTGPTDWFISTSGLRAGDTLSITVAVPEPQTWAMLLAGLGLTGLIARRRTR